MSEPCSWNPLFYDCADHPCGQCPYRDCGGGCGQMALDCCCESDEEDE